MIEIWQLIEKGFPFSMFFTLKLPWPFVKGSEVNVAAVMHSAYLVVLYVCLSDLTSSNIRCFVSDLRVKTG